MPFAGATAHAEDLLILTSYETEVVTPVIEAFAELRPGVTIRHLNKNTNAAVAEILSGNGRQFDLFWASSAESFEVLATAGRLVDVGYGQHVDFAYSAVGWTWRSPLDGMPPQEWNDLLDSAYTGRIAMSHPMQSGSTHSLIETILQHRGWEAGGAWLLELAGQLKTISARSFGVLEGVEQGRWDIGLTIDFLALKRTNERFVFRYGRPIVIVPARIAALRGGQSADAARAFIAFLTSPEGQRRLLDPAVRRIPVDADVRGELSDTLLPEVRAALQFSWSRYDPILASRRYDAVNALFDVFVARDFLRRRDLWRRLRALGPEHEVQAARLQAMMNYMPVEEYETGLFTQDTAMEWAAEATAILDRAEAKLDVLEAGR